MISFPLSLLQDTAGVSSPNLKALIGEITTFISHVLPPILCYFLMAVLAITPQTQTIRLALCPVVVLLALRATVPVDMLFKITQRKFHHYLAHWIFVTTARALIWGFARKPLVRQFRPVNSTSSTFMDALDLVSSLRGYGWDWSRGVHIPRETRPSDRTGFVLHTVLSAASNAFAFGILHMAIRSFSLVGLRTLRGGISGGSIFDETLPFYLRFLRSSIISALALVWTYAALQSCYDLCTILGVLILGQDPTQWPPVFDAPWRATSLADFWGRRWHQLFRQIFLYLGGYPLSSIVGRAGIVIGSFLVSAVYHDIVLITLNSESEWRMLVGFGMVAVGILIEDVFKDVTRRKVGGLVGWVWTMGWILLWGNVIVDGYMRAGRFGFSTLMDLVLPVRMLVEYLVTEFDNLLHAISRVPVA
ncbi:hypothetical protein OG21DRAFT_1442750 [Imleria badia]|nr:hypothetical protein OG21DRAFT_1442750 [Imleria badia]